MFTVLFAKPIWHSGVVTCSFKRQFSNIPGKLCFGRVSGVLRVGLFDIHPLQKEHTKLNPSIFFSFLTSQGIHIWEFRYEEKQSNRKL